MGLTRAELASSTNERARLNDATQALVGSRCSSCGAASWPPRAVCAPCGSDMTELEDLPTHGTLLSYTTVWIARDNLPAPYVLGRIDLGHGATLFAHVRGLAEDATVPSDVSVVLAPTADHVPRFWFEPSQGVKL